MLEMRRLGQSKLSITRVGIGTAPMGSSAGWWVNWGAQDENEAMRAIEVAIEMGVNWIDTAPFYGWGRAEEIVGKALRRLEGGRGKVFIFTKCGTLRDAQGGDYEDHRSATIRREIEESLRRLQTDYIDLYQFHDPDPRTPIEESWGTMQELIREGKVRYGGLSNHPNELVERALKVGPVVSHQQQYSLLHRDIEQNVLPFAERHGIGMLAWSPLASGFLTDGFDLERLEAGDFRRRHHFGQEPFYSQLREAKVKLGAIARARGKTLADLAIAWVLRQPGMTGAIIGVRGEEDARRMSGGLGWALTEAELREIDEALVWR